MHGDDHELKQRISMLMDSDLNARDVPRLIEKLGSVAQLKTIWARYHMIGDGMRNRTAVFADEEFASRISKAIQSEPTILAPRHARTTEPATRHKVVGLALAASLAGLVVLVGKSVNDTSDGLYRMAQHDDAPAEVIDAQAANWNNGGVADAQFEDYLLTHNETAVMAGAAGMLPNARLVSVRVHR
jgi:sigma-E factor negative regulatory protein RseA